MNDILEEFETLKTELINHYRNEFSSPSVCYTIPVNQAEVEVIKKLISIVDGRETCEVMVHCWNTASREYPKMRPATQRDFPLYRQDWNTRGVRA